LPIVLIDEGMQIEESDEQYENADSPRVESLQPDSNVTVKSFPQDWKQCAEIVSTDEGIQIDPSE
jgi:hypothetical protein